MKKAKRILAVVMSLLIMAIVPLNAFAANIVDSIDLTVDVEPGMKIENYEEYITVNTPGVYCTGEIYVYEVYEEQNYDIDSYYFEPGRVYEIIIIVDVTDGYVFADREADFESVTVNDEEVYFESYEYDEAKYYAVFATVETDGTITDIDLTVDPVAGYMVDDYYRYVKINTMGVVFEEALDRGVNVTDAFGCDPFNYFIEEEYILEICLAPAFGCKFAKDDAGNIQLENVTVNGKAVEYIAHIESNRGYFEYVIIELNVTPAERTAISVIELTINDDLKGYDVEDYEEYITIETEGVNFDINNPSAVCAYNSDYEEVYTFDGGDYYWLLMNFTTEEGYFFDPVSVAININGYDYTSVDYYTYESEDGITVEYVSVPYVTDFTGNFFDRIIAWFVNIFEAISNFFFGWISI